MRILNPPEPQHSRASHDPHVRHLWFRHEPQQVLPVYVAPFFVGETENPQIGETLILGAQPAMDNHD